MAQIRNLKNPPILEAVLDIKFQDCNASVDVLKVIADSLKPDGNEWIVESIRTVETIFSAGEDNVGFGIESTKDIVSGYCLKRLDNTRIFQLKADGVAVNHIKSYNSWENFESDFKSAVIAYTEHVKPNSACRLAARFINRIQFQTSGNSDAIKCLVEPISVPVCIESAEITDFSVLRILKDVGHGFSARINQATVVPGPGENFNSLVIDVDIYKEGALSVNYDDILVMLSQIRNLKNQIFFGLVTDYALEKYV